MLYIFILKPIFSNLYSHILLCQLDEEYKAECKSTSSEKIYSNSTIQSTHTTIDSKEEKDTSLLKETSLNDTSINTKSQEIDNASIPKKKIIREVSREQHRHEYRKKLAEKLPVTIPDDMSGK